MDDLQGEILNHLPVGLWVARAPSGEVVYANEAFGKILGIPAQPGALITDAPSVYGICDLAGNPYPAARLPFSRALESGGEVMIDDLVIHRPDGTRVNVRALAAPLRRAGGEISHVMVAFHDITAEMSAKSQGRSLQHRLRFTLDHSPLILFAIDKNGIITLSEGAGLRRLGFRPGEVVGREVQSIYGERYAMKEVRRALAGEAVTTTVEVEGAIFELTLNPVLDARGAVEEVVGVCIDATEQRKLQAQVIENDRMMAMGTLAASVAHEINNPLTYVLGNLDRMEEELDRALVAAGDPAFARACEGPAGIVDAIANVGAMLAEVRAGAQRVQQVAQDLRSFVREPSASASNVDLRATIGVVLQLVRKELETHAELVLDLHPTAPVRANESRLVQVILNLVVNAWQALPASDPARHKITLRTYQDGPRVVIEIADTGPGVPPELQQRIFEPFFTTREIGGGPGLGLFVCRNIVHGFGGEITTENRPEGGALFRVRLPASTEEELSQRAGRARPAAGKRAAVLSEAPLLRRILIIDDDELVAGTLVHALKTEFEVVAVHDAHAALSLLLSPAEFDLVYCDLMMKGLTGMEIYEEMRRRAPHRLDRLVFMTGGAFTARAARFVEEVREAVVYKPFRILAETRRRLGLIEDVRVEGASSSSSPQR